jgi:predicted PurR-regulated permease PerM
MAFLDVIPVVGATIGAIIIGLVTLFVDFPTATIIWIISQVVYQQVETQWIRPIVYQRAIDMYPLVGIVSVLFGAELLGVLGAIIAVPVAAALQILARDWWRSRAGAASEDAAVAAVDEGGVRGTKSPPAPPADPGPQPAA